MAVAVSAVPIALGTSPGGLIDGWLLRPAGHANAFFAELVIDPLGPVWALLGVGAAIAVAVRRDPSAPAGLTLGAAKLAFGLVVWLSLAGPFLGLPPELTRATVLATPFAWLTALGGADRPPAERFLRIVVPALAILQTLHAFPVPGAQLGWGEILFVAVGGVCIADGGRDLAALANAGRPRGAMEAAATLLVVAFGAWFALDRLKPLADKASATYAASVPLDLPGAHRLRVEPPRARQLRELTDAIDRRCDTFVTLPGMNSLYVYTGERPPEELSSTWMIYLTEREQDDVVRRLRSDDRSLCAVRKPDLLRFWAGYTDGIAERPLVRFIRDDFRVIDNFSGYYLAVRKRPG
jgi:hypothetical protein